MKKNIKSQQGVTFVEMIITVTVLSVALLSLILVIIYGIRINQQAKYLSLSYQIANKEMETIRSTPYDNLVDQADGGFYSDSSADLAKLPGGQGQLTIEEYNSDTQIKKITIKVNWNDIGRAKSTVLVTLVSEGGINQ